MAMQYDVKSIHISAPSVAVGYRTRLKGAVVSSNTSAASRNTVFANNASQSGTYSRTTNTVTVTMANHGLATGDRVWLDFSAGTGGTATDNVYAVTVSNSTTFTVTDSATGSITGNPDVVMYADILMEVDCYNPTAFNVVIPGEGILANDGIFVGVVSNVTTTVFYG